jgi:hypothetical protein
MRLPSWLRRIGRTDESWVPQTAPQNPPKIVSVIRETVPSWRIVSDDFRQEGVRVYRVQLGAKAVAQILDNRTEFDTLQAVIDDAPKSYRQPRRVSRNEGGDGK